MPSSLDGCFMLLVVVASGKTVRSWVGGIIPLRGNNPTTTPTTLLSLSLLLVLLYTLLLCTLTSLEHCICAETLIILLFTISFHSLHIFEKIECPK